ncbi:MAG: hypothetical protein ACREOD_05435 [Candidatus Dormibacteria bacterium]
MADVESAPPADSWPDLVRIALGLLLLADAWLDWHRATYLGYGSLVYGNASVSPSPLGSLLVFAAQVLSRHLVLAGAALAAVETALGLLIATGLWTAAALLASIPLLLAIWLFGQGLGLPFTPGSTDLGSGLLYALLAALLWVVGAGGRFSLDRWAERGPGGRRRRQLRWVAGVAAALVLAAFATQALRGTG